LRDIAIVREEAPAPAVVKTVEEWATAKGLLPQRFPGKKLQVTGTKGARTIALNLSAQAEHGPRDNPKYVAYAAAKAMHRWPEGAELTEADFDAAVAKAYGPTSTVICR
jgi:hypothetical protein